MDPKLLTEVAIAQAIRGKKVFARISGESLYNDQLMVEIADWIQAEGDSPSILLECVCIVRLSNALEANDSDGIVKWLTGAAALASMDSDKQRAGIMLRTYAGMANKLYNGGGEFDVGLLRWAAQEGIEKLRQRKAKGERQ